MYGYLNIVDFPFTPAVVSRPGNQIAYTDLWMILDVKVVPQALDVKVACTCSLLGASYARQRVTVVLNSIPGHHTGRYGHSI